MARYPATREGMYRLLGLSSSLQSMKQRVNNESRILRSKTTFNDADGIYGQIRALCDESMLAADDAERSIDAVTNRLYALADRIAGVLPFNMSVMGSGNSDPRSISGGLGSFVGRLSRIGSSNIYQHIICDRLAQLPNALAKLYGKFGPMCRLARVSMPDGAAYYDPDQDAVFLDQMADATNPLGAGNTHFHENAHQIDCIAGRANGDDSPYSYQRGMADAIRSDFDHAILNYMAENDCTSAEARQWLTNELRRAGNVGNCVSDVFGGASAGTVRGPWGHRPGYFTGRNGQQKLAAEAFAEISADYACGNADHIAFTQKFMPRTMRLYHEIIGELTS